MSIEKMKPPYRSTNNIWYTRQLFFELSTLLPDDKVKIEPIFSLKGRPGFVDARATFVELGDPTGYKWAMSYLKSWEHFEHLLGCIWFTKELESWIREIDIIHTSRAVQRIKEIADDGGTQSLAAAKYLAQKGWEKRAGRPTKEAITGELKKQAELVDAHTADMERIGLRVVK